MTFEELAVRITAVALIVLALWCFRLSWTVNEHSRRHDECEKRTVIHTRRHAQKGL